MSGAAARRLESWKEIAQYVGREVRTVIRWEKERGLPVHRLPGGRRAGVFAYPDEIDRWVDGAGTESGTAGSPERPARRRLWLVPSAAAAVGIVAVLLWSLRPERGAPLPVAGLSLETEALLAKGPDGSVLWRHRFPRPLRQLPDASVSVVHTAADVDGDGMAEHLVNVPWLDVSAAVPHELFCFSATGEPVWSVRLTDEVVFRGGRYGPPWVGAIDPAQGKLVAAWEIHGIQRVAWAQNHETWWPAILTVLDSQGRTVSKWIHAGNIRAVAPLGGEPPRLLVVGTSNSRAAAFLAVLDARDVSGSGPEEPGSPYECLSCPPGRPLRYFVFPPSELTLADLLPYNHGVGVKILPDGFEVHTQEVDASYRLTGIYRFCRNLQLRHAVWSDGWLPTHRWFEREGKIDHAAEDCPEAKRPPRVLEWEPGKGFHEVPGPGGSGL